VTRATRLDEQLASWFEVDAAAPAPADLAGKVADRTRERRPRSRWLATLHELAVGIAGPRALPGPVAPVAWAALVLLATLVLVLAAVVGARLLEQRRVITSIAADPLLLREWHQAVRLTDGRVLVVGGSNGSGPLADAALVDPWSGAIEAIPMVQARASGMAATPLDDGRVLITGGQTAEVFDPRTEAFSPLGDVTYARTGATVIKGFVPVALRLTDGRILVVGGTTEQLAGWGYPRPGDIFDPVTGTFSPTPPLPCVGEPDDGMSGQEVRTADVLPDGRILLSCERWWHTRYATPVEPGTPEQRFFAFDLESGAAEPVEISTTQVVSRTLAMPDGSLLLWLLEGTDRLSNGEKVQRHALARLDLTSLATHDLDIQLTQAASVGLLDSGHVVVVGGHEPGTGTPSDDVRVLDPCTGHVTHGAPMTTTRVGGSITTLDATHLLLVGGQLGQDPDMHQPALPEVVTLAAEPAPACTS
jgi:hypothetical protein